LTTPLIDHRSVDFPAPFAPITATISPSSTRIETPRSAITAS
jgi:hypothetical protein